MSRASWRILTELGPLHYRILQRTFILPLTELLQVDSRRKRGVNNEELAWAGSLIETSVA